MPSTWDLGDSGHSDVQGAIACITAGYAQLGKTVGIYAPDVETAKRYRDMGMHFIALRSDVVWLTRGRRGGGGNEVSGRHPN